MSKTPRHVDDFSTNPLTNPAYLIHTASKLTYDGINDWLTVGVIGDYGSTGVEVLNTDQSTGEVIMHIEFPAFKRGALGVLAFGYVFVLDDENDYTEVWHEEDLELVGLQENQILPSARSFAEMPYYVTGTAQGDSEWRIVANNLNVLWYIDGILQATVPARAVSGNVRWWVKGAGGFADMSNCRLKDIAIYSDSEVPLAPIMVQPAPSGNLPSVSGPIIFQVPRSRLYIDLTDYAGIISGVTSVIFDPAGANIPMTEETGDGTGDYYFESPALVGNGYRITIKEEFRIANSVVVNDTTRFTAVGVTGAVPEDRLVQQDDDLHFRVEIDTHPAINSGHIVNLNWREAIELININADGNADDYVVGGPLNVFDELEKADSRPQVAIADPGITYPVLLDIDLGATRNIKSIAAYSLVGGEKNFNAMDIYTSNTPFSGPSLAQGTLAQAAFPVVIAGSIPTYVINYNPQAVDIKGRYIRFVFLAEYLTSGGSPYRIPRHIVLFANDYMRLDTDGPDAAQFEYSTGGAFGAFPPGGIPPSDDTVTRTIRLTLPPAKQLQEGLTYFMRIRAKADLTD